MRANPPLSTGLALSLRVGEFAKLSAFCMPKIPWHGVLHRTAALSAVTESPERPDLWMLVLYLASR
jgi:hypothetical protein